MLFYFIIEQKKLKKIISINKILNDSISIYYYVSNIFKKGY